MALPVQYREGSGNFVFNVDYFDWATGAGYKKYYFLATKDSVGLKYTLTDNNTIISDAEGIMSVNTNAQDVDFDLEFNNNVTIANAVATISYTVNLSGTNATSITAAWTVYHYDGSTETSLGTVTDATTSDGDPTNYRRRTVQVELTEKKFNKGDILRVNVVLTAANPNHTIEIDPSGHLSHSDSLGGTVTSSADINIPFKITQ